MKNVQTDLTTRLTEVQEELINANLKHQNMKDRQSFKTLGVTTGIALAFIGITLGHNWTMRIAFIVLAALLILGAIYGIKKVDRGQLEELKTLVTNKQDQIASLKSAIKLQQAEIKSNEH
jgi:Flp pilus assembly protein TadB